MRPANFIQDLLKDLGYAFRVLRKSPGYLATGNYFEALGIKPALGRFFTPAEDAHPNASPYAVLSYTCWRNRFAGDREIAGKYARINGHPYTVLGVAPRGFHGTEVFYWPEIWVPMMMQPQIEGHSWLDTRNTFNAWIAGRLKTGVPVEQAEANLKIIALQLAREHTVNEGMKLHVISARDGGICRARAGARLCGRRDAADVARFIRRLRESCRAADGARGRSRARSCNSSLDRSRPRPPCTAVAY